jgi:hypothetical protein
MVKGTPGEIGSTQPAIPFTISIMIERPLDGDLVYSLKISGQPRTLAKRRYAMELSLWERVMTSSTGRAGVAGYRLFEAANFRAPQPTTLPEAIALNPYSQVFLLSLGRSGLCLVTSRIGYNVGGPVEVRQPDKDSSEILLYDLDSNASDDSLMARHLERMRVAGADPDLPLAQPTADMLFRDMVGRAPEMP